MELDETVELESEMLEQAESLEQNGTSKMVIELMGWVELVNSEETALQQGGQGLNLAAGSVEGIVHCHSLILELPC